MWPVSSKKEATRLLAIVHYLESGRMGAGSKMRPEKSTSTPRGSTTFCLIPQAINVHFSPEQRSDRPNARSFKLNLDLKGSHSGAETKPYVLDRLSLSSRSKHIDPFSPSQTILLAIVKDRSDAEKVRPQVRTCSFMMCWRNSSKMS